MEKRLQNKTMAASHREKHRRESHESLQFNGNDLTENDIEVIWKSLMKRIKKPTSNNMNKKEGVTSVETTPTTNYSDGLFPLHPETMEEVLEEDERQTKMNSVLREKKLHPHSNLPQVILYDNVSHDRLLAMRLEQLRHAHAVAEKQAKRREETFVKSLERKQKEWKKRDAKIMAKLEPENVSEFNFTFGRLYNKPDYPYQAAILAQNVIQPRIRQLDYARRRPTLLPQVTNRAVYDDDEDQTFITRLPKKLKEESSKNQRSFVIAHEVKDSLHQVISRHPEPLKERVKPSIAESKHRSRRKERKSIALKNWTNDDRFHTLTELLGERYSPRPAA